MKLVDLTHRDINATYDTLRKLQNEHDIWVIIYLWEECVSDQLRTDYLRKYIPVFRYGDIYMFYK